MTKLQDAINDGAMIGEAAKKGRNGFVIIFLAIAIAMLSTTLIVTHVENKQIWTKADQEKWEELHYKQEDQRFLHERSSVDLEIRQMNGQIEKLKTQVDKMDDKLDTISKSTTNIEAHQQDIIRRIDKIDK